MYHKKRNKLMQSTRYKYTTAYKTLPGDLHTPVSTYLKVRDLFPQSILMESSDYHSTENNKSFIGFDPIASICINRGEATLRYPAKKKSNTPSTVSCRPLTSKENMPTTAEYMDIPPSTR